MANERKARLHTDPHKDREFEDLLRRAVAFVWDRRRSGLLKVEKKRRSSAA